MTDTNKERAEFEARYASQPDVTTEPERSYELDEAGMNELIKDCIWEGWKARAAKAPAAPTQAEFALRALVAAGFVTQAKVDEALTLPGAPPAAEPVVYCDPDDPLNSSAFVWPGIHRDPRHTMPLYTAPPAPTEQWVSVAERLPNPHQDVLLAIEGGHVTTGSYMPSLQCFYWEPCDDEAEDSAVTHWMNKPAPPQGAAKGATDAASS